MPMLFRSTSVLRQNIAIRVLTGHVCLNKRCPFRMVWLVGIIFLLLLPACSSSNAPLTGQFVTPQRVSPTPATTARFRPETPLPGIAATVTAIRKMPTLAAEQRLPYITVEEMVIACDAFHTKRQIAVLQHLSWLANPQAIPPEFITLYGDEASTKLAFGAVYLVAVQWKVDGRQPESCLIPIGNRLNEMVVGFGGKPVPEFATP